MTLETEETDKRISALVSYLLEMLQTWMDAVWEINQYLKKREVEKGRLLALDLREAVQAVKEILEYETETYLKEFSIRCENCLESLNTIFAFIKKRNLREAEMKLEFELQPFFRIGYIRLSCYKIIGAEREKKQKFLEEEAVELCKNYYIEQAKESGQYKYDLTICVLAYNNLDYTKICVESVLEYMPRTLRCELVLINHGSTDGTKEYFETIQPEKQIDIKINGLDGFMIGQFVAEGEFMTIISNDVIVTARALELMVQCLKEDRQVAFVVPLTPNIENLQGITPEEISYRNIDELKEVTKQFNTRERRKEEQRVRLLTPIYMVRMEYWTNSQKTRALAEQLLGTETTMFGDDALSLYFRRAHYKNILMKDIYCYHYGSKTVGKTGHDFLAGRQLFYKKYGIDAWERGACWNFQLFQKLICEKADAKRILGINEGMGGNSLKIKEELKERTGNIEVKLMNYTMEKRFLADLQGVSDEAYYIENWESLLQVLEGTFDYIILSGGLEENHCYQKYLEWLYQHLEEDGIFIFQSSEKSQTDWFEKQYREVKRIETHELLCCKEESQIRYCVFCKKTKEEKRKKEGIC